MINPEHNKLIPFLTDLFNDEMPAGDSFFASAEEMRGKGAGYFTEQTAQYEKLHFVL